MFLGEKNNKHNNLNEFLDDVFNHIELKDRGIIELRTETGRPDFTTFYELQFIYKSRNNSNLIHTELRQVNHDDSYSIGDIVKARIYDVEYLSNKKFDKTKIERSKNSTYFHIGKFR